VFQSTKHWIECTTEVKFKNNIDKWRKSLLINLHVKLQTPKSTINIKGFKEGTKERHNKQNLKVKLKILYMKIK